MDIDVYAEQLFNMTVKHIRLYDYRKNEVDFFVKLNNYNATYDDDTLLHFIKLLEEYDIHVKGVPHLRHFSDESCFFRCSFVEIEKFKYISLPVSSKKCCSVS